MGQHSIVSTQRESKSRKMKLSQLISISTVYAAAEGASTQGRRPRREAPSITCPPSWVLDPNDSTKCLPDAGKTDFDINCGPSSMMLTFNYNHLYENIESFLDGNMYENTSTSPIGLYTNGKDACNIIRAGSYVDGKFTLSIDYKSSCVTLFHGNDEISVSTTVKGHTNLATITDYDQGVEVHVGQVLQFNAVCKWADTKTVEVGALSVTTADFSSNAVLRTRVTLVTLHSRRHSAWLPTRIQHDLPLWIRTRTQSRLARNFTSQSLKLTQWNRQAHSSGMLPIVRSGPRQVKLVQTTKSSRTTPNADQSFWELQQ